MFGNKNPYIYISGIFASGWAFAGWMRPDGDYIMFPFLVAMAVPIAYRLVGSPMELPVAIGAGAAGALNTTVIALVLNILGILGAPQVIPQAGSVGQAMILGVFGAGVGAAIAVIRRSST